MFHRLKTKLLKVILGLNFRTKHNGLIYFGFKKDVIDINNNDKLIKKDVVYAINYNSENDDIENVLEYYLLDMSNGEAFFEKNGDEIVFNIGGKIQLNQLNNDEVLELFFDVLDNFDLKEKE